MKKRLLFIIPTLNVGGAEKSLVNLLNEIDYDLYEVDLFLMSRKGLLLDQVPNSVRILPESDFFNDFSVRFHSSIFKFFKSANFKLIWKKIQFTYTNRLYKNPVHAEQRSWQYLKYFFPVLHDEYDAAIGYLEKTANYIAADCVSAKRKIGWIHTDLQQLQLDFEFERKHFAKLHYIVTVSEGLSARLKSLLPECSRKIKTIENINSKKAIETLAAKDAEVSFDSDFTNIIFVGRLEKVKGLDIALDAVNILLQNRYNIRFYLIGDGSEKQNLIRQVHRNSMGNNVFFLGMKSNPYPYIKNADIYILTSHYEGKSISLEEAKLLRKPIVITDFSSAQDQIVDGVTGIIAHKNAQSIADNLEKLINDKVLADSLTFNLRSIDNGTENPIKTFYHLIE